ncbi:hypothetical protein QR680_012540 [Steinernema hermaphroditum]|uniref:U1-type domain-containing protein n=1 Tax=Steinernema hermaphroditum TaxID=289476 RepID=A0AA39M0X1_9BILA|nr:hypothetical protein QR680_012540 [Steinernema hermaphroditum]
MMSINPAIAHVLRNRSDFCHICGIKVKTTTWKEHRMGRQHRDSIQPLKEEFTGGQQQKAVPKRPVENGTTVPNEPAARSRKSSAPWERERNSEKKEGNKSKKQSVPAEMAGVPDDFFEVQVRS